DRAAKKFEARPLRNDAAWPLRSGKSQLHTFHQSNSTLCRSGGTSRPGRSKCVEKKFNDCGMALVHGRTYFDNGTQCCRCRAGCGENEEIGVLRGASESAEAAGFDAVVIDVRNYGLLIELPEVLLTGLVHVSTLTDDFYIFSAAQRQFIGRQTRRRFA